MGEIGKTDDAEHQGKADGTQCNDTPENNPVNRKFQHSNPPESLLIRAALPMENENTLNLLFVSIKFEIRSPKIETNPKFECFNDQNNRIIQQRLNDKPVWVI
jgi:hypothetical protein